MENTKLSIPHAIILAGIIIAAAIFLKSPTGQPNILNTNKVGTSDDTSGIILTSWKVKPRESLPNQHILGNQNAEIQIFEYSDTECPFCKNFHKTMHQVIDNYNGEVAWVYKQLPLSGLHKYAYNEAIATECAEELGGNVAFWQYLDLIFENTSSNDGLPPAMLTTFAQKLKLDANKFAECLNSPKISAEVDADIAEVKTLTDRLATPFAVIKKNGAVVDQINGALSYAQVIEKIEAAKLK